MCCGAVFVAKACQLLFAIELLFREREKAARRSLEPAAKHVVFAEDSHLSHNQYSLAESLLSGAQILALPPFLSTMAFCSKSQGQASPRRL